MCSPASAHDARAGAQAPRCRRPSSRWPRWRTRRCPRCSRRCRTRAGACAMRTRCGSTSTRWPRGWGRWPSDARGRPVCACSACATRPCLNNADVCMVMHEWPACPLLYGAALVSSFKLLFRARRLRAYVLRVARCHRQTCARVDIRMPCMLSITASHMSVSCTTTTWVTPPLSERKDVAPQPRISYERHVFPLQVCREDGCAHAVGEAQHPRQQGDEAQPKRHAAKAEHRRPARAHAGSLAPRAMPSSG